MQQKRTWVRISNACNSKCLFCLDSDSQNWSLVEDKKIKEEIRRWYKKWEFNKIIISGGEASIHPKFSEYINYAQNIWYDKIQTITNGIKFENLDFCKEIIDSWLQEITFSLHGHNPLIHDYLTWIPWSFQKAIKGLLNIRKFFPNIIVNIDIVLNKVNINFIPDIIRFYNKLWVYEFDLLQIIPFGRAISNKNILFYDPIEKITIFEEIGALSRNPKMVIWTNRLPPQVLEWYEDLIQDPNKIESEILWEGRDQFEDFFNGWISPDCYKKRCNSCFLKDFCENIINRKKSTGLSIEDSFVLSWKKDIEDIHKKYWDAKEDFIAFLKDIKKPIINVPKCLGWTGVYETYNDIKETNTIEDYTEKYISDLYRKKSLRCKDCKYNKDCEWIHINFIRSYGFGILQPIK